MKQFEYKQLESNYHLSIETLNEYGSQGWELVHIIEREDSMRNDLPLHCYLFKREINQ